MNQRNLVLRFAIFSILVLSLVGCSETARFNKIATELENQGKYREAADNYYSALQAKRENENAQIGMQRTGQKALNDYISKFNNYYDFEDYDKSYEAFNEILNYRDKVKGVGITLDIEKSASDKFRHNKEILAQRFYEDGEKKIKETNWTKAIECFLKVKEYIPTYKEVNTKLADSYYMKGKSEFNKKEYRDAYYTFDKCISVKSNHKDASSMKSKSLDYGKVVLGLFPFRNRTSISKIEDKILSKIKNDISKYDSPFIIIKVFNNKKNITESEIKRIGNGLNIDIALIGEITEPTKKTSQLKKVKSECYETYTVKNSEGKNEKKGKKTYWYYHTQNRELTHKVNYILIDIHSNKIIQSRYESTYSKSSIEYGTYPGEKYYSLEQYDPGAKLGTFLMEGYRDLKSVGSDDYVPPVEARYFKASTKLRSFEDISYSFPSKLSEKISENICPILDSKE